jgi:dipeptidyl aminopeptidase/acylaminoacyl peptidase
MPHGGPNTQQYIGYDAWAQFMVNRGINVMQPNFRGSTGLGTAHYKAGNMEWGKKMQDDITDAVEWAIENGYADRDRICIAGASYGGYSTMAGLVFTPEVYRCGINAIGVTDQQQLLDNFARKASKFQSWDEEPLLEWGDLSTPEGREYAKEISPLLYVQNIQAPVLVLQGSNDRTVEPFHAEDLITQLEKYNKTYESMFQAYAGHCVTGCGELAALEYLEIQESFLNKYLMN